MKLRTYRSQSLRNPSRIPSPKKATSGVMSMVLIGGMIRRIVLDPATGEMSPRAEALLYAADKAQHVFAVVRPALDRGAVVVCDRYVDSMLAYQGAGRVLELADLVGVTLVADQQRQPGRLLGSRTVPCSAARCQQRKTDG